MELEIANDEMQKELIKIISYGLPLVSKPYQAIAKKIGCSEEEVITRINMLTNSGNINRFGVVVRHHNIGYKANAMVVWDIVDEKIDEFGLKFSSYPFVTLCYHRLRNLPKWRYNLFSMIHGKDKDEVLKYIKQIVHENKIQKNGYDILFSTKCFKQRGAIYKNNNK